MRRATPLLVAAAITVLVGCGGGGPATVTVTAPSAAAVPQAGAASPPVAEAPLALPAAPPQTATGPPRAALAVAPDGCGVLRSEFTTDPDNLQWSVSDTQGFQVLGRNAVGETRYRYFRPGTYTVVLVAFLDGRYAPISNAVRITCNGG